MILSSLRFKKAGSHPSGQFPAPMFSVKAVRIHKNLFYQAVPGQEVRECLLCPAELLVVGCSAGIQVKACDLGVVCTNVVSHVQRNLRALFVDCLTELCDNLYVLIRINRCLNLFNQSVDLRLVGTCLVGSVDGAGVIYAKSICQEVISQCQ